MHQKASRWTAAALALAACVAVGQARAGVPGQDCDRHCLDGLMTQYLQAMLAHDPSRVPWAPHVKFTENNVPMQVGDGLWGTITRLRPVRITFADPQDGSAAYFGVVEESGDPAIFGMRIREVDRKISEVETIVARKLAYTDRFPSPNGFRDYPVFDRTVPPNERRSREQLVSIANSYYETLQQNDGTVYAPFAKNCDRVENGVATTNNKVLHGGSGNAAPSLGCAAQFKTGNFRFVTRVRDRRFPVVDVERQIVLASVFFDHAGDMRSVTLTDGKVVRIGPPFDAPYSFITFEFFKIVNGRIRRIDADIADVPYWTKTAWPR